MYCHEIIVAPISTKCYRIVGSDMLRAMVASINFNCNRFGVTGEPCPLADAEADKPERCPTR